MQQKFTLILNQVNRLSNNRTLVFEWEWCWSWPCFDRNLNAFLCKFLLISTRTALLTWQKHRFLSKQSQLQPYFHSKARRPSTQLFSGLLFFLWWFVNQLFSTHSVTWNCCGPFWWPFYNNIEGYLALIGYFLRSIVGQIHKILFSLKPGRLHQNFNV